MARFVDRDRQHPGIAVESLLNSVAVVGVDVHIGDAHTLVQEIVDGQGRVVENAEPGGVTCGRMVQSARYIKGRAHFAAGNDLGGEQRPSGAQGGRFKHVGIDRVVPLAAEAKPSAVNATLARAKGFDRGYVLRGVQPGQFIFGCGPGVQQHRVGMIEGPVFSE